MLNANIGCSFIVFYDEKNMISMEKEGDVDKEIMEQIMDTNLH